MKVWDRAVIKLSTPGSAVRQVSAVRHVTACAMRPENQQLDLWLCEDLDAQFDQLWASWGIRFTHAPIYKGLKMFFLFKILNQNIVLWVLKDLSHNETDLQKRERIGMLFSLFLIQNICCGYSKEPSQ